MGVGLNSRSELSRAVLAPRADAMASARTAADFETDTTPVIACLPDLSSRLPVSGEIARPLSQAAGTQLPIRKETDAANNPRVRVGQSSSQSEPGRQRRLYTDRSHLREWVTLGWQLLIGVSLIGFFVLAYIFVTGQSGAGAPPQRQTDPDIDSPHGVDLQSNHRGSSFQSGPDKVATSQDADSLLGGPGTSPRWESAANSMHDSLAHQETSSPILASDPLSGGSQPSDGSRQLGGPTFSRSRNWDAQRENSGGVNDAGSEAPIISLSMKPQLDHDSSGTAHAVPDIVPPPQSQGSPQYTYPQTRPETWRYVPDTRHASPSETHSSGRSYEAQRQDSVDRQPGIATLQGRIEPPPTRRSR